MKQFHHTLFKSRCFSVLYHGSSPLEGGPGRLSCALNPRPAPGCGGLVCGDSLLLHSCSSSPYLVKEEEGGGQNEVQKQEPLLPSSQHRFQQRGQESNQLRLPAPDVPVWRDVGRRLLGEDGTGQSGGCSGVWDLSEEEWRRRLGKGEKFHPGCSGWVQMFLTLIRGKQFTAGMFGTWIIQGFKQELNCTPSKKTRQVKNP